VNAEIYVHNDEMESSNTESVGLILKDWTVFMNLRWSGITLEAGAYAEGRLLKISVKAGISIGASGAKATTDPIGLFVTLAASSEENKPTLSGNVEFSGLQIYYIKFAEMSRKEGVNANDANSGWQNAGGGEADIQTTEHNLEDAKTLYTVIKDRKLWEFGKGETSAPQALTQV
jgi:hypothetical protein